MKDNTTNNQPLPKQLKNREKVRITVFFQNFKKRKRQINVFVIKFQQKNRTVDEFDFDEDEFLAALEENQPIGTTGEIAKGSVIAIESDGIYVDIGGKAPGFMPKNECGLGVITNLKERFPKGLQVEVLVTREQNADGMLSLIHI